MATNKTANAERSGSFVVGDIKVHRLGFGAMRITGKGVWGEPVNRSEALRVLKRLPELGVNFIDTADSYGPEVSENLIREALHPYDGLLIATKGGLLRHGPERWPVCGRPDYLRHALLGSLRRLRVDRIDLWQLHRIDPTVPREEQFDAIRDMRNEGLIRHVGLSEVSVDDIRAAEEYFNVVTVQNKYNLVTRQHEEVLEHCTRERIGFIPWYPLAAGNLAEKGTVMDRLVSKLGCTPGQLALAWCLKRSPVMLPIPGTGQRVHLDENVAAAGIELGDEDFRALDEQGVKAWKEAERGAKG